MDGDFPALLSERERDGAANPLACAGDERGGYRRTHPGAVALASGH
jgi:hypothetical protein